MNASSHLTDRSLQLPEILVPPTVELTAQFLHKKFASLRQKVNIDCYSLIYDYAQSRKLEWLCKRMFDLMGAFLGLIILSPLFMLIACAIKLDSKGPVLFTQERVGYRGKQFLMYKFRSMQMNAENRLHQLLHQNETNVMFKIKQDPRITRVGKFLRKFSLDEFPQLLNVLKGEMSLVGPRPPIVRELSMYEQWHHVRFSVLPGMTGLWQVCGRSNIKNFDDVVCLDAQYIENWSFWIDLKLILKTIPTVLLTKGSY